MSETNEAKSKKRTGIKIKAKGEPGYIKFKKRFELFMALGLIMTALALFVIGLVIFDGNRGNILTIVACLLAIPMARFAATFVMFFPFKSVSQEKADEVAKYAKPGSIIYSDVVLTSDKNAMSLDFVVITSDKVIGVVGRSKDNNLDIRNYLKSFVSRRGFDYTVSVAEDYTKFYSLLKASDSAAELKFENEADKEAFDKDRAQLCVALESLMP